MNMINEIKGSIYKTMLGNIFQNYKKTNTDVAMYMLIGVLSAVIFILIYGVKILNPTYTDWLMSGGDLSQHYLGWVAYRNTAWRFPIGMADMLSYPSNVSVIFTDSIPVFAVLFKLLSPVLPSNFQYFGLWGILCFVLQGVFASRIINNYSKSRAITAVTSMMVVLAPVMIWRMYGHTALAGQWIILFGLDLLFNPKKYLNNKRLCITIAIMGCLAPAIHMYFVLMCGIIVIGYVLNILLEYKDVKKSITIFLEYFFWVAITTFFLGGWNSGVASRGGGLGIYSFNLNAFFNPFGLSGFLKDLSTYGNGQYEGFAYLGAGFLLLFCSIFFYFDGILKCIRNNMRITFAIIIVAILSLILALSPIITLNDKIIFEMTLPQFVINLWEIFRSTGRFIWVAYYIIIITSIIGVIKFANKISIYVIFSLAFILQFFDLRSYLRGLNDKFNCTTRYITILPTNKLWDSIANNDKIKHIVYSSSVRKLLVDTSNNQSMMYSFTNWALKNNKTVSDFYFARYPKLSEINRAKSFANLSEDTVFLFSDEDKMFLKKYSLHYYKVDGLIVGYMRKLEDFPEIGLGDASQVD